MERIGKFCTNCGSALSEGAKFCGQCGAPTQPHEARAAEAEPTRQPRGEDAQVTPSQTGRPPREDPSMAAVSGAASQTRKDSAPVAPREAATQPPSDDTSETVEAAGTQPRVRDAAVAPGKSLGGYKRFLRIDPSGGFLAVVTPLFIWIAAAGILAWAVLGLISLRFDLSFLNLEDLFFTMLIIIGIMLSVVANAYLALSYRDRAGALWQALSFLPVLWAAFLCVGLSIMIWQVWTDFAGGPNELRRAMFSLVGVGICGMYGGYLSLVVIGPARIYQAVRRVVYVLIALVAVEILDALWWGARDVPGIEMWEHFLRAGLTAVSCAIVYAIIAFFMAQARSKGSQTSMLVAYVILGVFGFTIAVGALWDTFPPGAIRFVHGAIVIVIVATIGLLVVQHFEKKKVAGNPPAGSAPSPRDPRQATVS
ncbi:MAG: zinc-ribbon domain-containing protein [Chloroflexi bacterium]|nr:zinc-ribbon domain-containing protein [Chloroflexota bacterium]